jgi:hypothetical protein
MSRDVPQARLFFVSNFASLAGVKAASHRVTPTT